MRVFTKEVERRRALKLVSKCFEEVSEKYGEPNAKWAMQKVVNDARRLSNALKRKQELDRELSELNADLTK